MRVVVARHFDRGNHSTMRETETEKGREEDHFEIEENNHFFFSGLV